MRYIILITAIVLGWLVMIDTRAAREDVLDVPPSQWDDHLIELDKQALDAAYKERIGGLYDLWMKDYSDTVGTPKRVAVGARNARNAYIHAMTQLERRKTP